MRDANTNLQAFDMWQAAFVNYPDTPWRRSAVAYLQARCLALAVGFPERTGVGSACSLQARRPDVASAGVHSSCKVHAHALRLVQEFAAAEAWALQSVLARLAAEAGSLDTALRAVCGEEEQANLHGGPLVL